MPSSSVSSSVLTFTQPPVHRCYFGTLLSLSRLEVKGRIRCFWTSVVTEAETVPIVPPQHYCLIFVTANKCLGAGQIGELEQAGANVGINPALLCYLNSLGCWLLYMSTGAPALGG